MKKRISLLALLILCTFTAINAFPKGIFKFRKNSAVTESKMFSTFVEDTFTPALTLEDLFFVMPTDIPALEDDLKFSDFSELPEEYDVWNNTTINPYNRSLVNMGDTIKIDISGYHPPCEGRVTSDWGFRKWKYHYGIDLKVYRGDTVKCAFDGTVRITRRERGYGYFVVVRHNNGLETLYGHLDKILVKNDQEVKAGEPLGMGGNTGRSTGYHLHLEFRYLGNPINPHDIACYSTFAPKNNVLFLSSDTFAYKKEIDKIRFWTVKSGDTLGRIAARTGVSINKLCALNGIKRTTILRIGRKIRYT